MYFYTVPMSTTSTYGWCVTTLYHLCGFKLIFAYITLSYFLLKTTQLLTWPSKIPYFLWWDFCLFYISFVTFSWHDLAHMSDKLYLALWGGWDFLVQASFVCMFERSGFTSLGDRPTFLNEDIAPECAPSAFFLSILT